MRIPFVKVVLFGDAIGDKEYGGFEPILNVMGLTDNGRPGNGIRHLPTPFHRHAWLV